MKKMFIAAVCLALAAALSACGAEDNKMTESEDVMKIEDSEAEWDENEIPAGSEEIDPDENLVYDGEDSGETDGRDADEGVPVPVPEESEQDPLAPVESGSAPAVTETLYSVGADCGYMRHRNGTVSYYSSVNGYEAPVNVIRATAGGTYEFGTDDGLSCDEWRVYIVDSTPDHVGNWDAGEPAVVNDGYATVKKGQYMVFVCIPPNGGEETESVYWFQVLK